MNKLIICSEYCSKYLNQFPEQILLLESKFGSLIPLKPLTRLSLSAIITWYKGGQGQVDTPKFKQLIFQFLNRIFIMNTFKVEGDLGRHFLSIHGASVECGISTSSINRMVEQGTYPPKNNITSKRRGFRVYQVEQWLQGQRGGWQ